MKKRIPTFLGGMLTMALVGSLGVGALAATGSFTITVDPINIQVNGATFVPKNEKGEEVPVFAYDGTTYAPLRALAEAYGLEVGYDAETNMATVGETATTPEPDPTASPTDYSDWTAEEEAAYQEFKGMWEIELLVSETREEDGKYVSVYTAHYNARKANNAAEEEIVSFIRNSGLDSAECRRRLAKELMKDEEVLYLYFTNTPPDGSTGSHILPYWTIENQ